MRKYKLLYVLQSTELIRRQYKAACIHTAETPFSEDCLDVQCTNQINKQK